MEIIKEVKALHRKYVREEKPNSIVLNLKNWPDVDWCYIHRDKRGWGTYIRNGKFYNIGRGHQMTLSPMIDRDGYYITRKSFKVLTDNIEVERVYTDFYRRICSLYMIERYFKSFLKINPKLLTNLWDYYNIEGNYTHSNTPFDKVCSLFHYLKDDKAETIKQATGLSMNYFKIVVAKGSSYMSRIKNLKDLGYSPEDVAKYINVYDYCPSQYLNNRKILDVLYAFNSLDINTAFYARMDYRDYLRMISNFPADIKKNFPLCPQDVKKYHDKAIVISNRYQQQIQEAQHKEVEDKYINNVYPLAKEYEYSNNEYVIIAPKSVFELSTEGKVLSHCVGSYIQSVSNGKEYILFLRKKDQQDVPYFTINITPDKEIRQIHGKYNCNVPEILMPFINSWVKKFNLTGSYNSIKCHL